MAQSLQKFKSSDDLRLALARGHQKVVENLFGDKQEAMKFLSNAVTATRQNPKLLECDPSSVINSFVKMAQFKLMPSDVSGEAYVLPYNSKNGLTAQFQLGYQGLVTLFYRAGVRAIYAEVVKRNDYFKIKKGKVDHEYNPFDDRGEAVGAYVTIILPSKESVDKFMTKEEIIKIGERYSKSYQTASSPWKEQNDPQLWMWKKTVLKQSAKLIPKNETVFKALAEDNEDSVISDRLKQATVDSESLKISKLEENANIAKKQKEEANKDEDESEEQYEIAEGHEDEEVIEA